jgi:hypothetical protein
LSKAFLFDPTIIEARRSGPGSKLQSAPPHETTADQLFSEEQFEVYRALGFHAVTEVFSGRDQVGMRPKAAQWQGPILNEPLVKAAKELLNWT